jgi:hypothetical protein
MVPSLELLYVVERGHGHGHGHGHGLSLFRLERQTGLRSRRGTSGGTGPPDGPPGPPDGPPGLPPQKSI